MKVLVVLSFAAPEVRFRSRLVERARRAVAAVAGRPPAVDLDTGDSQLLLDEAGEDDLVEPAGAVSVALTLGAWTRDGRRKRAIEHLHATRDPSWPSAMVPPFGACVRPGPGEPFTVTTDTCGLRHLYLAHGEGWAACSTSSLVLAAVSRASLDADSVTTAALAGHQIGDRTPFTGVVRLSAGNRCELRAGTSTVVRFAPPGGAAGADADAVTEPHGEPTDLGGWARVGADAVAGAVGHALEAHPDTDLELSGGLDSRMILAALPKDLRHGRRALTLASPGSADVDVARRLAAASGLDHEVIDLAGLCRMPPGDALRAVRRAALRRDATGDPVAGTVLDLVAPWSEGRAVLTGQNGELARGYYYPGQPRWPHATRPLVHHLARWRILTSAPIDGAVVSVGLSEVRRRVVDELEAQVDRIGGPWPAATDELYLAVRMQNWVGRDFSTSGTERQIVAPFFHPAFVCWARATSPAWKRASRIFAAALEHLDPNLATVPLDTGVRPSDLAHPSARGRLTSASRFARKVLAKAGLRVAPSRGATAPAGAPALAALVRQAWAAEPGALSRLAAVSFLDAEAVEAIASGRRGASPATVGFLAALDAALETLGHASI